MAKSVVELAHQEISQIFARHLEIANQEITQVLPSLLSQAFGVASSAPAVASPDLRNLAQTVASAQKKGPGRPKKAQAQTNGHTNGHSNGVEVKRGPGRPKKVTTEDAQNVEEALRQALGGGEKKGRGRPKGSKNKPKEDTIQAASNGDSPKKRGRPKGSKNKPKDGETGSPETSPSYEELKQKMIAQAST